MIDIENELFTMLATLLRTEFPGISVTGEYTKTPSVFPCVSIIEMSNTIHSATTTSSQSENHVDVMYEINVYSNKTAAKKSECKKIASVIDEKMLGLGFVRTMLEPIPNLEDSTIYRLLGRYQAVVGKDDTIYRR